MTYSRHLESDCEGKNGRYKSKNSSGHFEKVQEKNVLYYIFSLNTADHQLIMQLLSVLLASASVASAHYNFPAAIYAGVTEPDWQHGT